MKRIKINFGLVVWALLLMSGSAFCQQDISVLFGDYPGLDSLHQSKVAEGFDGKIYLIDSTVTGNRANIILYDDQIDTVVNRDLGYYLRYWDNNQWRVWCGQGYCQALCANMDCDTDVRVREYTYGSPEGENVGGVIIPCLSQDHKQKVIDLLDLIGVGWIEYVEPYEIDKK